MWDAFGLRISDNIRARALAPELPLNPKTRVKSVAHIYSGTEWPRTPAPTHPCPMRGMGPGRGWRSLSSREIPHVGI